MTAIVINTAGLLIRAPWESEEAFQARIEQAIERAERGAEMREEAHRRYLEITGQGK